MPASTNTNAFDPFQMEEENESLRKVREEEEKLLEKLREKAVRLRLIFRIKSMNKSKKGKKPDVFSLMNSSKQRKKKESPENKKTSKRKLDLGTNARNLMWRPAGKK